MLPISASKYIDALSKLLLIILCIINFLCTQAAHFPMQTDRSLDKQSDVFQKLYLKAFLASQRADVLLSCGSISSLQEGVGRCCISMSVTALEQSQIASQTHLHSELGGHKYKTARGIYKNMPFSQNPRMARLTGTSGATYPPPAPAETPTAVGPGPWPNSF